MYPFLISWLSLNSTIYPSKCILTTISANMPRCCRPAPLGNWRRYSSKIDNEAFC